MKLIIVLCATLPLTVAFFLNYSNQESNHYDRVNVNEIVYAYAQKATQDGMFESRDIEKMKDEISEKLGIAEDDIKVTTDRIVRYRPEDISYKVEVTTKDVVAMNKYFDISEEENKGRIVVEGEVMSERLKP